MPKPIKVGRKERMTFSKINEVGQMPNLIEIQTSSYDWFIKEGLRCNYGFNISIGDNCFFNYGLTILDSYKVEIGSNVFIAPNVIISPVTHPLQAENRRNLIGGKIVIEDDVWIGAGAVILPGVRLARGAVVAAGAVVKSDVREYEVVGGIPAKHIKNVNREGEKYGID